jgi:Tfp pilus assembly protein PilN
MRIRLNLATTPLDNDRRFNFGAGVLIIVGVLALLGLTWRAYNLRRVDETRRAELAKVESEVSSLTNQRAELEKYFDDPKVLEIRDRSAFFNSLIQERSFPWTRIFMDFEELLPEGVRIVNISPRLVKGHVELHLLVGAMTDEGRLKFIRALETSKSFSHLVLMSESRPQRQSDQDHVYLELTAWYAGD